MFGVLCSHNGQSSRSRGGGRGRGRVGSARAERAGGVQARASLATAPRRRQPLRARQGPRMQVPQDQD